MNIIRELKTNAISRQKYEFAAWVRDIEREASKYSTFEDEVSDAFLYELVNDNMKRLPDDKEVRGLVKKVLREHKINKLFDK